MDVLTKIRKLQSERNWSDYKLAQEADIPVATLSSLFQRGNLPKVDTLQCICNAFGLTLAQFFLEDESIDILSGCEKEMLATFRKLSSARQQALINLLRD